MRRAPAWPAVAALAAAACGSAASAPSRDQGQEPQGSAPAPDRGSAAAPGQSAAGSAAGPTAAAEITPELLGAMATLAGAAAEPAQLAEWAQKIARGQASLGGYIDELLRAERFGGEVMPSLLFGSYVNIRNYYAVPAAYMLKRAAGASALYLRTPCPAAEAVKVRPWWNLDAEVEVCPDAYRPAKWSLAAGEHSYRTQMVLACDSQVGSPELETHSLCGCGPNLIRCLRDEDQYNELNHSIQDEIRRTTAYVVEHDLPMASLFTGNSTFRDRNVELYYRRQKIGALELANAEPELADLGRWPERGQWAPRPELRPGQHAGVLTAPQLLHWQPDRRQRQRAFYEVLWCNLRNSFGATTRKVLEINATGNNFFVHDSWQRLAHTELCMNCHARLDYGSQFLLGYPDSRASIHFVPSLQLASTGPLYGRDIRDPRGEGPLTPLGFAKLATEQPDFAHCMTDHFVSYVLGDRATTDDIQVIGAAVERTRNFKAAMKVALELYAARWEAGAPAPAPTGSTPPATGPAHERAGSAGAAGSAAGAAGSAAGVAIPAALRDQLDRLCVDCHDQAPYSDAADSDDLPVDFRGAALPRALLVSMADQVAFGMMPKNQPLDPPAREEVVGALIDTLWREPTARAEARRYFLGRARGLPAHQLDNVIHTIDHAAGAISELAWGALERGLWSDQATITPGFLALTGLEALRACARGGEARGAMLEACLLRTTSPKLLSRWPSP